MSATGSSQNLVEQFESAREHDAVEEMGKEEMAELTCCGCTTKIDD